jgi:hypothetical protein
VVLVILVSIIEWHLHQVKCRRRTSRCWCAGVYEGKKKEGEGKEDERAILGGVYTELCAKRPI